MRGKRPGSPFEENKGWEMYAFEGAGACYPMLPLGATIANKWAKNHNYPLEDSCDLVRVYRRHLSFL